MPEEKVFTASELSGPERNRFTSIKRDVMDLGKRYGIVREKIGKIAPKVIQLFKELDAKYSNLGGFIGFCRLIDPTVPRQADDNGEARGYRNHSTYQALIYMQRLERAKNRPARDANAVQGQRNPATDQLARLLASILTIKGIDEDLVWSAVADQFGMPAEGRTLPRLKARVEKTKALIDLSKAALKGPARVIPMRQPMATLTATAEALEVPSTGRRNARVRIAS